DQAGARGRPEIHPTPFPPARAPASTSPQRSLRRGNVAAISVVRAASVDGLDLDHLTLRSAPVGSTRGGRTHPGPSPSVAPRPGEGVVSPKNQVGEGRAES